MFISRCQIYFAFIFSRELPMSTLYNIGIPCIPTNISNMQMIKTSGITRHTYHTTIQYL